MRECTRIRNVKYRSKLLVVFFFQSAVSSQLVFSFRLTTVMTAKIENKQNTIKIKRTSKAREYEYIYIHFMCRMHNMLVVSIRNGAKRQRQTINNNPTISICTSSRETVHDFERDRMSQPCRKYCVAFALLSNRCARWKLVKYRPGIGSTCRTL